MTVAGIDVSHHQGAIDWRQVAGHGARFAFLKATEGLHYVDKRFATNAAGAHAAGLKVGAYHFARPGTVDGDAEHQARHLAATIAPHHLDLAPVLDIESTVATVDTDRWALDFLAELEHLTGRRPLLYTYAPFATQHLHDPALAGYQLWIAAYRATPPLAPRPWRSWAIWQRTSNGTVPGIDGRVDLNVLADTLTLDDITGITTPTPPQEDDDMRYKDWPVEDKMLLANDVANVVVERLTNPDNENEAGGRIKRATHAAEAVSNHFGLD